MLIQNDVILASQSPQRKDLFASLGIPFSVVPADIDELAVDHPDHEVRAMMVAVAKAEKVALDHPTSIIISADTFVVLGAQRLEKPATTEMAKSMLQKLGGSSFEVFTGWAIVNGANKTQESGTTLIKVSFRPLSLIEVEKYVSQHPVTSWADGFSIKNLAGISLVSNIQGSLTGLMGLPIEVIQPIVSEMLESNSGL